MIDTSSFERIVFITKIEEERKIPHQISFYDQNGKVTKCYKYRIRKVQKAEVVDE